MCNIISTLRTYYLYIYKNQNTYFNTFCIVSFTLLFILMFYLTYYSNY